jgi:hypothetical protein
MNKDKEINDTIIRLQKLGVTSSNLTTNYAQILTENIDLTKIELEHPKKKEVSTENYIVVDSRDRDYSIFPNSNNYTINLFKTYRNVVKIELVAVMIPKSEYNINNGNCSLTLTINSVTQILSLRPGQYTIGTNVVGENYESDYTKPPINGLIAELKRTLDSHSQAGSGFDVWLCTAPPPNGTGNNASIHNRIAIINKDNTPFSIDFTIINSCYKVLGFDNTVYQSSTNYVYGTGTQCTATDLMNESLITLGESILGLYDYNLLDDPKSLILDINVGKINLSRTQTNSLSSNEKFAVVLYDANEADTLQTTNSNKSLTGYTKLLVDRKPGILKALKGADFDKKIIEFNPSIIVKSFDIKFTKYGDYLYDFHNREHILILQFTTYDYDPRYMN